jgi:hypothetical protein
MQIPARRGDGLDILARPLRRAGPKAVRGPHVHRQSYTRPVRCIIVASKSPAMVLLSPGTMTRPVAPGTFGSAAGLVIPAPGPATMLDEGVTDAAAGEADMSVHAPRLKAIPKAVKVIAILVIEVFLFSKSIDSIRVAMNCSNHAPSPNAVLSITIWDDTGKYSIRIVCLYHKKIFRRLPDQIACCVKPV